MALLWCIPSATPGQMLMSNQACDPDNVPLPAWNFMHNAPDGPDELEFFRAMLEKPARRMRLTAAAFMQPAIRMARS